MSGSSEKRKPNRGREAEQPLSPSWTATYLFLIVSVAIALRIVVWLVTGGRGLVAAALAWATEPFVYVFNRYIGLPTFGVGQGRLELGSLLALILLLGTAAGVWILTNKEDAIARAWSAMRKGEDEVE